MLEHEPFLLFVLFLTLPTHPLPLFHSVTPHSTSSSVPALLSSLVVHYPTLASSFLCKYPFFLSLLSHPSCLDCCDLFPFFRFERTQREGFYLSTGFPVHVFSVWTVQVRRFQRGEPILAAPGSVSHFPLRVVCPRSLAPSLREPVEGI